MEATNKKKGELIDYILDSGKVSLSLVKNRLGYDDDKASEYLKMIDQWQKKDPHYNIQIDWEHVKENYDTMNGIEFEDFTVRLLLKLGYTSVEKTKATGDQCVDVIAEKDGVRYAVQCKNYTSALGNTPVQEINAGRLFYTYRLFVSSCYDIIYNKRCD